MNNPPDLPDKKTFQEKLSYEEIKEKLKNYVKVKKIADVPLYTHLRYIETKIDPVSKKKIQKFRLGGYLINKNFPDKYVVLSAGKTKWSVQVATAVFYKSILNEPINDLEPPVDLPKNDKAEKEIESLKEIIIEQELKIKKLKDKNKALKKSKKKT